jgi:HEAT repeat protein
VHDREPIVRLHAAYDLARLDPAFDPIPTLAALLDESPEPVRIEAVKALTTVDDPARAEPAIRKALQDKSDAVRAFAQMALLMTGR